MTCKDSGYLGRSYMMGTQVKNALPVPVVVVVTEPAAAAPVEKGEEKSKTNVV